MANPVVNTAICTCSFGTVPMVLPVTSQQTVMMGGMPAATILDNKCTTFGMCSCLANPAVAAATAAAFGALTPSACIPLTLTPWAAWGAHGKRGRETIAQQHQQTDVQLRWRDSGNDDACRDHQHTLNKEARRCRQRRSGRSI